MSAPALKGLTGELSSKKIVVRPVDWSKDLEAVQVIWADGFRLIVPLYFREIAFSPMIFGVCVAVCSAISLLAIKSLWLCPVLLGLLWGSGYLWFHTQVEKSIRSAGVKGMEYLKFWVADVDGAVAGCVGVVDGPAHKAASYANGAQTKEQADAAEAAGGDTAAPAAAPRKVASIWRLTVSEQFRKFGLGRLLMDEAEKFLKEGGYTDISLLAGHIGSQIFYDRLKYTREKVAWHLGNHESIYFSKKLVE